MLDKPTIERIREKIKKAKLTEKDIKEAVKWARKGSQHQGSVHKNREVH